ncbi:hypothetical protein K2W83_00220 [Apilactobacillus kunkeei]|jgi:hypothetical protein|nr:hypothetical protein [Apilactobacillus kunkeei]MCT6858683.1 hypothetical protein [Apilactobacillus sp.]QYU53113.1 hypothetical protein K2W83_00220 [Apilactobacillus kunkeei]
MLEYIVNHIYLNSFGLMILVPSIYYLGKSVEKHGSLKEFLKDIEED